MKAGFVVRVLGRMLIGHRLNAERVQTYLCMSAKNIGNFINRFRAYFSNPSNGPLIAQGRSRINWTLPSQTAGIVMLFALSAGGQPIQSGGSSGGNRVMFPESFKEVATIPGAPLVRSELASAEARATLDFSVALKMHNFAELQNRVAMGEIISLDEIASKYYPPAEEHK